MTYTVKWSHEFKRNVKRAVKRGLNPSEMKKLISLLRVTQLPPPLAEITRFTASSRDAANVTFMATGCLSIAKTELRLS